MSNSSTAASETFGQTPFGKMANDMMRSARYFIEDNWEVAAKWVIYLASLAATVTFWAFSDACNELAGGEITLLIISIVITGLTIVALLFGSLGGSPFSVMDDIPWLLQGLMLILALGTGILAGKIHPTDQSRYVELVDGKPLLSGETAWVYPWQFSRVTRISKLQDTWLLGLPAQTSDGTEVLGHVHLQGRLSENPDLWVSFESRRESFLIKLKEAYVAAVKQSSLADLEKALLISSRTEVGARGIFTGSAIVPDRLGAIEATDFKIAISDQDRQER